MFYPSPPLFIKRLGYTVVLCSISFNLYLGELQNAILQEGKEIIDTVDPLLPTSSLIAKNIEETIIPIVQKAEEKKITWLPEDFGMFSSQSLRRQTQKAQRFEQSNIKFKELSDISFYIIKYVNLFMWLPIVFAGLWMFQDLKKGKYKFVTMIFLIAALFVNMYCNHILNTIWPL